MIGENEIVERLNTLHLAEWLTHLAKNTVRRMEETSRGPLELDFTFSRKEAIKKLMRNLADLTNSDVTDPEAFKILARMAYMAMIYMTAIMIDQGDDSYVKKPEE